MKICTFRFADYILRADHRIPIMKNDLIIATMKDTNSYITCEISEILNDAKAICEK